MRFTPLPTEYEGGLDKESVDNLKAFVQSGGILVTLNDARKLAIKEFEPPARNIPEKIEPTKKPIEISGGKRGMAREGIEPPTQGFSVLRSTS